MATVAAVYAYVNLGATQKKLSFRLGSLLEIEIDAQDGLPSLICDKYKRFVTLENACMILPSSANQQKLLSLHLVLREASNLVHNHFPGLCVFPTFVLVITMGSAWQQQ